MQAAVAAEAASFQEKLGPHVEGQVLVRLKGGPGLLDVEGFSKDFGAKVLHKFDLPSVFKNTDGDLVQLQLPAGLSTAEALALMGQDDRVAYAVPNHTFQLDAQRGKSQPSEGVNLPDDLDPRLWGLNNSGQDNGTADADIDAPEAWTVSTGARVDAGGPIIATIDTGADYNHPDLKDNIWTNPGEIPGDGIDNDGNGVIDDVHGYNALAQTGDPMDGHSHGTHVAGTIAASGNNTQGVVGVNWNATVMPIKIFSDQGSTDAASIIRGITYATRMGARVTSNSWGGGQFNQAIYDAFKDSPALHIMAAGNSGTDNDRSPHYPSSYDMPNNVAVAASDRNDAMASFSCYGKTSVDLAAPGVDIYSTVPTAQGSYDFMSGTSMATPHVSGVAGLIAAAYPNATNDEIKARLMTGSDKLPAFADKVVSGGRLNAANALDNDGVAPGAPNDLKAVEARSNGAVLQWTATGDDGWCGSASSYDLRFSDKPIVDGEAGQDQVSFEQANQAATGRPSATGTLERAEIRVIPSSAERTLYFALKVKD
ncbi:MAG: S8 family peptidase, partial [Candidatus Eremiobacterota bacterium]